MLEGDGLLKRTVYAEVPPRVDVSATVGTVVGKPIYFEVWEQRTGTDIRRNASIANQELSHMYGLIVKIRCVSGQRDVLASILIEGTSAMPGCRSYVVAADTSDPDALWVTEVWDSSSSHRASLSLPAVQQAIAKGKPLITGFTERFETTPVGGYGLVTN